jgi:E3 ubiquitin-protein ligase SHPRH
MESLGDFGSKIQTLVRHLLYLQTEDPGAKSIVFSAWADSLHSKLSSSCSVSLLDADET